MDTYSTAVIMYKATLGSVSYIQACIYLLCVSVIVPLSCRL